MLITTIGAKPLEGKDVLPLFSPLASFVALTSDKRSVDSLALQKESGTREWEKVCFIQLIWIDWFSSLSIILT